VKRLKIHQVLECGGPGGTGNQVAALCNGLDSNKFEITLVYSVRPGSTPESFEAHAHGAERFIYVPEMTREISPFKDLAALRRLYRLFCEDRPDIVHTHSSKAGVLARLAARAAGVNRILYSPRGYAFLQRDRGVLSRTLYWLIEAIVSPFSEIVACSPSEGTAASRFPISRGVSVVCDAYLGDPKARAKRPADSSFDREVCAAGRLTYARHPEKFVELAAGVLNQRDRVRMVWIGDGELRESVERERERLRLDSRFELTGWLGADEAIRRLSKAAILVHFSRWDGLPNAVLEAMALGIPVVASDIAGNRDAVVDGKTGYLVSDEMQLVERVLRLLDDPGLRERLGEAGRQRVEDNFTLARMIEQMTALYERGN
jgi:glycosyltransferase involved in cell wall biosynthesis